MINHPILGIIKDVETAIGSSGSLAEKLKNIGIKVVASDADLPTTANDGEVYIVKGNSTIYSYDGATSQFKSVGGGSATWDQVTKLGIGSTGAEVSLAVTADSSFSNSNIDVLKFVAGTDNVIQTTANFNNGDQTDFTGVDSQMIFDGQMKLKNIYQAAMVDNGALGTGKKLFSQTIDKASFKSIDKIEVI